jgi:hypothetical protein
VSNPSYLSCRSGSLPRVHQTGNGPDDHAGHLFARIFQGPAATINLTPMHANVNQSTYRRIENTWGRAISAGKCVEVEVGLVYGDHENRPTSLFVTYTIDGEQFFKTMENSTARPTHAKEKP